MRHTLVVLILLAAAMPIAAQVSNSQVDGRTNQPQPDYRPIRRKQEPGRVDPSSVGEVGQRRTRDEVDGIERLARIDSRIANRVQSRLRTRIDRNYDSQANALSPFAVADDQARIAGRATPRR